MLTVRSGVVSIAAAVLGMVGLPVGAAQDEYSLLAR